MNEPWNDLDEGSPVVAMNPIVKVFWNRRNGRIRALWRLAVQLLLWLTITIMLLLAAEMIASELSIGLEIIIESVGAILAVWLAGRGLDKRPFPDFGLHINEAWWVDFGFGLFLGGFLITLVFLIELAAGWIEVTAAFVTIAPNITFGVGILSSLGIFLLVGFQEELFFRGYIFTNFAEGLNGKPLTPRWAMIIATLLSASLFSLMHFGNDHAGVNSAISAFLGGIILTLGYLLTGELALSIGFHITWNAFQNCIFGFPVSGEEIATATFVEIEQAGPALWVGDAFGPESGLLVIGAVALGCALIMLWVRLHYGRVRLHTAMMKNRRSD